MRRWKATTKPTRRSERMDLRIYALLVEETRDAQKRYFAKRDNLDVCKHLERRLDEATESILRPGLFDQPPENTDAT